MAREYWETKKHLTDTSRNVDWDLRKKSLSNIPTHETRWYCKFCTGFCGTGKMLVRYKFQSFTNCPRCNKENEDTKHVLQCDQAGANELWNEELDKVAEWMNEQNFPTDMATSIVEGIQAWRKNIPLNTTTHDRDILKAVRAQIRIGWQNFIEGFWA